MALTPAERRARRDAKAQQIINPNTGEPFRNYNQYDTWQRNQKAKASGFKSRAEQRRSKDSRESPTIRQALRQPRAFAIFRGSRKITDTSAKDFLKAFGPVPENTPKRSHDAMVRARAAYVAAHPWDWKLWRDEYSANL